MADKVIVDFGSRTDAFVAGANKVKSSVEDIRGQLLNGLKGAMFAAFSVEALKGFREEFKNIVDQLEEAKKRTGAGTSDLQVWQKQIEKIGGSLGDVSNLMTKLSVAMDKATENPEGAESKSLEKLGLNRLEILQHDVPDALKKIQKHVSDTGTGIGSMGDLMDLFGTKSVKSLAFFVDSFDKTEEKMKKMGALIDENLIDKFKELGRLSDENDLGSTLLGGKEGKASLVTSMEDAWVRAKIGISSLFLSLDDNKSLSDTSPDAKRSPQAQRIVDAQTRLMLQGGSSMAGGNISDAAGYLTPAQYADMENKSKQALGERSSQVKRIKDLEDANAEKQKTDEEKLQELIKKRADLLKKMNGEQNKTKLLAEYEDVLRLDPKIEEQQDKVDKKNQAAKEWRDKQDEEEKHEAEKLEREKQSLRKKYGGAYQLDDSLISTGNFIGTARNRLEQVADRHTELFEGILQTLIDIKNRGGAAGNSFPEG